MLRPPNSASGVSVSWGAGDVLMQNLSNVSRGPWWACVSRDDVGEAASGWLAAMRSMPARVGRDMSCALTWIRQWS
ncbi:hypothetical protein HHA02_27500 [Cobetia marina]|nr:hypothetical protein HHA02_27500 [Cobetia marina]